MYFGATVRFVPLPQYYHKKNPLIVERVWKELLLLGFLNDRSDAVAQLKCSLFFVSP